MAFDTREMHSNKLQMRYKSISAANLIGRMRQAKTIYYQSIETIHTYLSNFSIIFKKIFHISVQ